MLQDIVVQISQGDVAATNGAFMLELVSRSCDKVVENAELVGEGASRCRHRLIRDRTDRDSAKLKVIDALSHGRWPDPKQQH